MTKALHLGVGVMIGWKGFRSSNVRSVRYVIPLIPAGFLVFGVERWFSHTNFHDLHTGAAVIFASAIMLVFFLLGDLFSVRKSLGWVALLLGADGRLSTSKTAMWLWTFGVGYALLFLVGIEIWVGSVVLFTDNWSQYLILLGGPFAAAVLAKYTVVAKLINGTIVKPVNPDLAQTSAVGADLTGPAAPSVPARASDVVAGDDGSLDVVDSQYFFFNLIAFAYAFGVFLSHNFNHLITVATGKYELPAIPSQLLALTGAAAATYVGNKALLKDPPTITAVRPSTNVTQGSAVLIIGVNLIPQGTPTSVAAKPTTVWAIPGGSASPTAAAVAVTATSATPAAVTFALDPAIKTGTVGLIVAGPDTLPTNEFRIAVA